MNPRTITALQRACREGDFEQFKSYSRLLDQNGRSLRHLLTFKQRPSIPLSEVESVERILTRFATGAMSFGSISHEAHSTLAVAMNRIGGKSNSGEGGEDAIRYTPQPNGDSECSAIKQIASGRFGVTAHYLTNAIELQIKMAQGAKPGEGLPDTRWTIGLDVCAMPLRALDSSHRHRTTTSTPSRSPNSSTT